jgi:hypothetical protein
MITCIKANKQTNKKKKNKMKIREFRLSKSINVLAKCSSTLNNENERVRS